MAPNDPVHDLCGRPSTCLHQAALAAGKVRPELIDTVCIGNVQQTSGDAAYLGRHVALRTGMAEHTPALNVNRLCGSGFQSVVSVAQEILLGEARLGLAAGAESMSQAPMSVYGQDVRWGTRLGVNVSMVDTLWAGLTDSNAGCAMGITAENLAEDYGINRWRTSPFVRTSPKQSYSPPALAQL